VSSACEGTLNQGTLYPGTYDHSTIIGGVNFLSPAGAHVLEVGPGGGEGGYSREMQLWAPCTIAITPPHPPTNQPTIQPPLLSVPSQTLCNVPRLPGYYPYAKPVLGRLRDLRRKDDREFHRKEEFWGECDHMARDKETTPAVHMSFPVARLVTCPRRRHVAFPSKLCLYSWCTIIFLALPTPSPIYNQCIFTHYSPD
jgi:hypothetical protein